MSTLRRVAALAALLPAPVLAQGATGTTAQGGRVPVNVIRPVDPPPVPPKDESQDRTIFFHGNGGYMGNIAGAGAAISSGGSSIPSSYDPAPGSTVLGYAPGYFAPVYAGGGPRYRSHQVHDAVNAPAPAINSGIAPGQTANKPYHPPPAYGWKIPANYGGKVRK